jgi:F-type H+-transporting ATPase subunit a
MDFIFHTIAWKPFAFIGLTHPFFDINGDTIVYTWIALGIITGICLGVRYILNYHHHTLLGFAAQKILSNFASMIIQATDHLVDRYYYFIASLFIFIFICNCLILIPGFEEPTKDLNTTFALALIAFFYIQKEIIKNHGFLGFIQEYMKMPFALFPTKKYPLYLTIVLVGLRIICNLISGIVSLPLELLSKTATIISLAFRLFGNIFAGSLITALARQAVIGSWIWQAVTTFVGVNLIIALFFGIFESFIQAYVFAMLSLTYIAMSVSSHSTKDAHD